MNKGGYKCKTYPGPIAYLVTLIENAASGAWQRNCQEYERRPQ